MPLPQHVLNTLLPYQIKHVESLVNSIKSNNKALDASDAGTGKTFSALAVCHVLGLKPLIICPKSVLVPWIEASKVMDVKIFGIANYELIQNCKYYVNLDKRIDANFMTKFAVPSKKGGVKQKSNSKAKLITDYNVYSFTWKLPDDVIVIFDEAHKCKNKGTTNSYLLMSIGATNQKLLMLSATVCDNPNKFLVAGYALGLYKTLKEGKNWILSKSDIDHEAMNKIRQIIFPTYASRMKITEIGKLFPDSSVIAECFNMDCAKEIQEMYNLIEEEVNRIKKKEDGSQGLGKIIHMRHRIETLKAPTYIKLAKEYIDKGNSVAIFVNFTSTLEAISEKLNTNCKIYGEQSFDDRNKCIKDFCTDQSRVIVCNIRSGGVGVSLHDTIGTYPRVSIISPSWSAIDIIQALGRIYRANTKTIVLQKIVFCKGTIEERICENMSEKITNIGMLNDGDLSSYKIENLIDSDEYEKKEDDSELDKLISMIDTLNTKKYRLQQEIKNVDQELDDLTKILHSMFI